MTAVVASLSGGRRLGLERPLHAVGCIPADIREGAPEQGLDESEDPAEPDVGRVVKPRSGCETLQPDLVDRGDAGA
jgi:hypothetical protein